MPIQRSVSAVDTGGSAEEIPDRADFGARRRKLARRYKGLQCVLGATCWCAQATMPSSALYPVAHLLETKDVRNEVSEACTD